MCPALVMSTYDVGFACSSRNPPKALRGTDLSGGTGGGCSGRQRPL